MTNDSDGIVTGNLPLAQVPSGPVGPTWSLWLGLSRCTPSQQSGNTSWKVRLAVCAQIGQFPSALRPISPPGPAHQNWLPLLGTCSFASPAIIRKPGGNGWVRLGSFRREPE